MSLAVRSRRCGAPWVRANTLHGDVVSAEKFLFAGLTYNAIFQSILSHGTWQGHTVTTISTAYHHLLNGPSQKSGSTVASHRFPVVSDYMATQQKAGIPSMSKGPPRCRADEWTQCGKCPMQTHFSESSQRTKRKTALPHVSSEV